MKSDKSILSYSEFLALFTPEEMNSIVQLKRFFEWAQGDPEFRASAENGNFSPEQKERLKKIGVTFELEEIALLWNAPHLFGEALNGWFDSTGKLSAEAEEALAGYPLLRLWFHYSLTKRDNHRRQIGKFTFRVPRNPLFDRWRLRRIASIRSELGFFGYYIDHPILTFELGNGCSVGCWFCALASKKLTQNLDYTEYRDFFRDVAQQCVEIFGKNQAGMTLLYYGTEPHDNPHYIEYVKDYAEITGHITCTSTAVPTDPVWVRRLIELYRAKPLPWPRFSVLSRSMLFKIHDLYTPDELRDIELLMQLKESCRKKVTAGRILEEQAGLREREDGHYMDDIVAQGSVACVTGFLINMVNRTIQLVSPCYTSNLWPQGLRVFDEDNFEDAEDFGIVVRRMIERNMPDAPPLACTARFRDDLVYRKTEEGFDLVSPNQVHHFEGREVYAPVGARIAEATLTFDRLYDVLCDEHGINPMTALATVKGLFDNGFLDEADMKKGATVPHE